MKRALREMNNVQLLAKRLSDQRRTLDVVRRYFEAKDRFKQAAQDSKCTGEAFTQPRDEMFAIEVELRALLKEVG